MGNTCLHLVNTFSGAGVDTYDPDGQRLSVCVSTPSTPILYKSMEDRGRCINMRQIGGV
jgi:hypothetical protein